MYKRLITFLLKERWGLRRTAPDQGKHWCRVVMDQQTDQLVRALPFSQFSVLEISGEKWSGTGFKAYKNVGFPDFDICKEPLAEQFDLVIAEQVFEHVLKPYRAVCNVFAMVRPGGYFLITTPFLMKIHEYPHDCTRWSEQGIKYLLHEGGFALEDIVTGSWGNLECVVSNFNRWTNFEPSMHSLENEPSLPVVVWALAKKRVTL
jgi:SAM-dependent methyltransferase